jgi:hypothetical protein
VIIGEAREITTGLDPAARTAGTGERMIGVADDDIDGEK